MKLIKVLREFNISLENVSEILVNKGYTTKNLSTDLISNKEYQVLRRHFKADNNKEITHKSMIEGNNPEFIKFSTPSENLSDKKIGEFIINVLELNGKLSAKEMAYKYGWHLNVDKSKLNRILYFEINNRVEIDENFQWSLKNEQLTNNNVFNIESEITIDNPKLILDNFIFFFTENFKVLETKNDDLKELIKLVVKDNVITETEKEFLREKTLELNISEDLSKEVKEYMFSNNPYLDHILSIIFKDGLVKKNELDFLYEKTNEHNFSKSFVNSRFWEYGVTYYLDLFLRNDSFNKIIKLWYVSSKVSCSLIENSLWLKLQLDIFTKNDLDLIIDSALVKIEHIIIDFLKDKYDTSEIELYKIYKKIDLNINSNSVIKLKEPDVKVNNIKKDSLATLVVGDNYKKSDIYYMFNVPESQQAGKWNNGYCEHDNEWFIFTNIDQVGHGYQHGNSFDYNNGFDDDGKLKWEAIKTSRLIWGSIQDLKKSTPFIFIRTPETEKNYWKYIGRGKCFNVKNTSPVQFTWEIVTNQKFNSKELQQNNLTSKNARVFKWNEKYVPLKHSSEIIELIKKNEIFKASQLFNNHSYNNGISDHSKILSEFEKLVDAILK